jgi:hypothetical protein
MTPLLCKDCGRVSEVQDAHMRALVEPRARPVHIAIRVSQLSAGPCRLMKGLQITRRHDCIPISTWLNNQVVSRMVIAMPQVIVLRR